MLGIGWSGWAARWDWRHGENKVLGAAWCCAFPSLSRRERDGFGVEITDLRQGGWPWGDTRSRVAWQGSGDRLGAGPLSPCEPSPALPWLLGETGNGAGRKNPQLSPAGEGWHTVTPGAAGQVRRVNHTWSRHGAVPPFQRSLSSSKPPLGTVCHQANPDPDPLGGRDPMKIPKGTAPMGRGKCVLLSWCS